MAGPFQKWLASSVDIIGAADSKNAAKDELSIAGEGNGSPAVASGSDVKASASKRSKKKG